MPAQLERIEKLLEKKDLSASNRSFAESLKKNHKKWGSLTPAQWSAFERMEARHDPAVINARKEWYNAWTPEMAKDLRIAAEYYLKNPPYFGDIAAKIIEDETYIPSAKLYRKMVENKYVQKVLATRASEPAYAVGSLVKVRKTAAPIHPSLRDRIAMVVANDGDVISHAKGAKTYTILPFGEAKTIQIQERWLKRHRG